MVEECDETTGIQSFYEYPTFVHQSFDVGFDDDDDDSNGEIENVISNSSSKLIPNRQASYDRTSPNHFNSSSQKSSCDGKNGK